MTARGYSLGLMVLALLCGLGGCGFTHNPSYFPYLKTPGDVIQTHAKPKGRGYFADFDPHAKTLVVRPQDGAGPARGQVVLLATVYDEDGQPRRNRRIEWMLEGAGNIVEVDESGYFPGRGYKVDNKSAVSYTDYLEHTITRGNDNPNDDFTIRPGQSWCVITSAVEGDTHVTVYAPGIHDWEKRKVHVSYHWVDAVWNAPPPTTRAAGSTHLLTTTVFRGTDRQPLANYRVRYKVLDGPPAVFLPGRMGEAEAVSDTRGNASVELAQLGPTAGTNRVQVEIVRPPDPTTPSAPGIVIGRVETTVSWQAPALALTVDGPETLALNAEGNYAFIVSNTGTVPLRSMTVRHLLPEGSQHVRSDPPANVEGNQLVWTLGELLGGQKRRLNLTLKQMSAVRTDHRVSVVSEEGLRDEKTFTTLGTQPALKVALTGPASGAVGAVVPYRITLTNTGSGPATNIILRATLDEGLEAETKTNPIELRLDEPLLPGTPREIPLTLMARKAGALALRLQAVADGNLSDRAEHVVQTREMKAELKVTGPRVRFAGRPFAWTLEASNGADLPLDGVVLRQQLPAEVEFVSASDGGQLAGREVVWNLGSLPASQKRSVQVTVKPIALSPGTTTNALLTASGVRVEASATLEIRGLPAFRMEVLDENDPIEVGGRTRYRIEVENQGSLRGNGVQVTATVPKQMRVLSINGASPHKVDGAVITFQARDGLEPQQKWQYVIEVEALQAGDARLQAELRAASLAEPVIIQQSTTVFAPAGMPPG